MRAGHAYYPKFYYLTMKNNFSRSNVNESTLDISSPLRSSFNLSHNSHVSLPLGVLMPCNFEPLLPTDVLQGSLNPQFQMEKIMTPSMGRTRLDTHTFVVNARRVNRDFVTLRGDNTGSKPSFNCRSVYGHILLSLLSYSSVNKTFQSDSSLDFSDVLSLDSSHGYGKVANQILDKVKATYTALLSETDCDKYGYLRDFYAIELERLKALPSYDIDSVSENCVPTVICEILKPYCGPGSQLDMLGYPVISQYSQWYNLIYRYQNQFQDNPIDAFYNMHVVDIFNLSGFHVEEQEVEGVEVEVIVPDFDMPSKIVDETPLRVVYAVWYDYFRNYHVETRGNFLDPDLFGSTGLVNSVIDPNDSAITIENWQTSLQLILPKYRMFARDYLTTVETADKFRFVYSPIKDTKDGELTAVSIDDDFYNEIVSLGLPTFAQDGASFPLPYFSNNPETDPIAEPYEVDVLRADLQTMRRSGMLEKWLARNYFYPDTYVGQLLARYQVTPSDVAIINAEYIGGNESFISDEQITANVTTDRTPMGQRVLKADVGLSDSFTYSATDYCYLVSFVSLMPLVSYDSPNMHLHELTSVQFPDPEFAEDTRVAVRSCDLLRGFDTHRDVLGYVPRFYQYRVHPDETHGRYLTDYRSYNWFRDWFNMNFTDFQSLSGGAWDKAYDSDFSLNPYSLRVHLEPDAFLGLRIWSDIAFGKIDIQCMIQRPLPAAVEFI